MLVQKVLRREFDHLVALVCIPGPAGIPHNECARAAVQELTNQTTKVTGGMQNRRLGKLELVEHLRTTTQIHRH